MKKEKLTTLSLVVIGVIIASFVMLGIKNEFNVKYAEASSTGNILFVGGMGPNNYTSIQDAIDNTSDGDTVYVFNRTYYENVVINKSINLVGEDKSNTIIDGNSTGDVIHVIADWVNISGFTIRNGGSNWGDAGIDLRSSHNTVSDNIVTLNKYDGIYLYSSSNNNSSSNNTIKGNTISLNNGSSGIELWFSCNNTIIGNNISSNIFYGILLEVSSYNNSIIGNQISPNNYYGIYLSSSNNNTFYHNNFINNSNQAFDGSSNMWDNGYPSGGNHWSDFDEPSEGAWDNNSDGIVDLPYNIPGGSNQDRYPLVELWAVYPTISLKYPSGGEVIGGIIPIQWNVTGEELSIKMEYKNDTVTEWTLIADDEENDGIYNWDATGLEKGELYMINITATDAEESSSSIESGLFEITQLVVTPKTAQYNETIDVYVEGTSGWVKLCYPDGTVYAEEDGSPGDVWFFDVNFDEIGMWYVDDSVQGMFYIWVVKPIELTVTVSPTEMTFAKNGTESYVEISGTVKNPDDTPTSGATVEVWAPGVTPSAASTPIKTEATNETGYYIFTDKIRISLWGAGIYNITARIGDIDDADAFGYGTMTVNPAEANVTLYSMEDVKGGFPEGEIAFSVTFPDGTALLPQMQEYNASVWKGGKLYDWFNTSDSSTGTNINFAAPYGKYLNLTPVDAWEAGTNYELQVQGDYEGDSTWEYIGDVDFEIESLGPNIVYVDDDFNSSTAGWGYDHFDSVQDGIDAVAENGTVYVYSGTYYENVVVNKSINLIGEDKNGTIIDGNASGYVVRIEANMTSMENFSLRNSGVGYMGIIASNKTWGVQLEGIVIKNCIIHNNGEAGIEFQWFNNVSVINCNVYNTTYTGIYTSWCKNAIIRDCNIHSNNYGAISLHDSSNHIISNCTISNNGLAIGLSSSSNNTISNNNISHNDNGIKLSALSNNNTILGNIISNQWDGLGIISSSNNTISGNNIKSSDRWGIYLWDSSNNNIIIDNDISNNFDGMWLYESKNNIAHYNNIHENAGYGIYNDNSEGAYIVYASYNYWGFPSGPYHPTLNPNGTGEDISDNVDFIPWLTALVKGRKEEILTQGENEINAINEADTTIEVNVTATNNMRIISYEEAPIDGPDVVKSIGKYIEIEVENGTTVQFPMCIQIYYTQADLDNVGITEEQIIGIYFYNESSEDWELFNDTGVNTTDVVVDGKQYAGYAWANAWHLTTLTIAGDNTKPEIRNVEVNPQSQEINRHVNTSCVVTDNIEVSSVFVNITFPDVAYQNFSMISIAETNIYYYNTTYSLKGSYEYFIWANDTSGNANASSKKSFSIGIPQYTLTVSVNPTNAGTIILSPSSEIYNEGTVVTVTANANAGFVFDYWSGDASSISDSIQITMDSNKTVTAHFSESIQQYSLTALVIPLEGGSVSPSSGTYMEGTVVTVTAYNNSGYGFTHWSGDASGADQSIKITMDSDKTITAHFSEIVEYTLTALVNPLEGGSVTLSPSGGVYDEGTVVTITAVANTGYELNHWSGDASGNDSAIQITMDNNKSITAHFVATNYRPTVSITFPLNGTEVKKTVTIQGTASDEDGNETIQKVEIKIGDEDWTVVNGTTSWNFSWDTTSVDNGDYIIQARSYDGYEHSSIDSVTMEVKNKEKDDGIPGFEMLVLIIAVGLIAIMRRKKQ